MSMTGVMARSVRALLDLLPHDYAVKAARKIRNQLSRYESETTPFQTPRGPVLVAGVRRSLGMSTDLGQFEPELLRWADRFIKPGDVVWDIGANVGLYTLYMARIEGAKIWAFEPSAITYVQLVSNIDANKAGAQVTALNAAITDRTRILDLPVLSSEPGFTSTTSADYAAPQESRIGLQSVAAYAGDDFAKIFNAAPRHIKLDVDGAEIDAIRGLSGTLAHIDTLLIEVIDEIATRFDAEILPGLTAAGLREVKIASPTSGRNRVFARATLADAAATL